MVAPQKALSLEEFLRLREEEPALEYEDGRITQKMSPKGKHSSIQAEFAERINAFARPGRLARAFPELRMSFAGRSYVPDVAVLRWERIPVDDEGEVANDFFVAPDVAVEVVSSEQRMTAVFRKCVWYVSNGVPVALAIDPDDKSVFVLRPGALPVPVVGEERIDLDDVLPGFQLTAAELFAALQIR
jgi:Uma2 family endonuclease